MPLINRLREKGFIVHAELLRRSVKAMLRDANRQNTRWTAVVGDLELEKKELNLKNMRDNTQQTLSWEKVENVLTQNPE
jgi:histidyl-tRNA synthetase